MNRVNKKKEIINGMLIQKHIHLERIIQIDSTLFRIVCKKEFQQQK